ncbi:uncharacterized protein LOC110979316 [Acanthaster planci]|uniref:Uncharacterized protein LOC110979316 n=1 Tax=Acanthaster planci TaxID=133434 RepID=A0A8B7YE79_ACAPL|nr:uncharacterized protein LOC110979316 [Acanthaster planci]
MTTRIVLYHSPDVVASWMTIFATTRMWPCASAESFVSIAVVHLPVVTDHLLSVATALATNTNGQLVNNFCLLDHIIKEFVNKSNPSCSSACIMEPACRSFNIKYNDQGQKICQLSDATRCDDPDKFQGVDIVCNCQECVD